MSAKSSQSAVGNSPFIGRNADGNAIFDGGQPHFIADIPPTRPVFAMDCGRNVQWTLDINDRVAPTVASRARVVECKLPLGAWIAAHPHCALILERTFDGYSPQQRNDTIATAHANDVWLMTINQNCQARYRMDVFHDKHNVKKSEDTRDDAVSAVAIAAVALRGSFLGIPQRSVVKALAPMRRAYEDVRREPKGLRATDPRVKKWMALLPPVAEIPMDERHLISTRGGTRYDAVFVAGVLPMLDEAASVRKLRATMGLYSASGPKYNRSHLMRRGMAITARDLGVKLTAVQDGFQTEYRAAVKHNWTLLRRVLIRLWHAYHSHPAATLYSSVETPMANPHSRDDTPAVE